MIPVFLLEHIHKNAIPNDFLLKLVKSIKLTRVSSCVPLCACTCVPYRKKIFIGIQIRYFA